MGRKKLNRPQDEIRKQNRIRYKRWYDKNREVVNKTKLIRYYKNKKS